MIYIYIYLYIYIYNIHISISISISISIYIYMYTYIFWHFIWHILKSICHIWPFCSGPSPMEPGLSLGAGRGPCFVQMGVLVLSRHGHMWRCECSLVLIHLLLGKVPQHLLKKFRIHSSVEFPDCFGRFPQVFWGQFTELNFFGRVFESLFLGKFPKKWFGTMIFF